MPFPALLQFTSFKTRLITYLLILLLSVLGLIFLSVNRSTYANTRNVIDQNLKVGLDVFNVLIEERGENFKTTMRALSSDFAFRQAYQTSDSNTLLSVSDNLLLRTENADVLIMVDYDYQVVADSQRLLPAGIDFPWTWLLEQAEEDENYETASFILFNGTAYHVVAVPILTPLVDGWIIVGERLDTEYVSSLSEIISSDVSILQVNDPGNSAPLATTLNPVQITQLATGYSVFLASEQTSSMLDLDGESFVALGTPLVSNPDIALSALVQQSLPLALAPYHALEQQLFILFGLGLALSAFMALLLGRSVTKPVLTLASRVQAIEEGNYQSERPSLRKDEIGKLQNSVNNMAAGLAEKEKVRDLLGKVVSREIADELMNSHVELGGERRRITILFSDIRNFTSLCEDSTPENILLLLNHYLSEVSAAIEKHKGVVDKYIGDAVMALFGAPVKSAHDTTNALKAALQIRDNVLRLNRENTANNLPAFHTGIGLHTGEVVAGNLGSANRLNYTVIGDPVNLASRLESLSKTYGGGIIVSEETKNEGTEFFFKELDLVRVKGKAQPVRIYELVGTRDAVTAQQIEEIKRYNAMLAHYRQQQWQQALDILTSMLKSEMDGTLFELFRERIEIYQNTPPGADWDGVFTFQSK